MSQSSGHRDLNRFVVAAVGAVCFWGVALLHMPKVSDPVPDVVGQMEAGMAAEGREAAFGRMMPSVLKRDRHVSVAKTVI